MNQNEFFAYMFSPFPSIAHLPHIVLPRVPQALKYILRVIDRKGGMCCIAPPNCPGNLSEIEEHRLWAEKLNQDCLVTGGCFYPQFVIDVNINEKLFDALVGIPEESMTILVKHIDKYRWFYMPISDEESVAAFVMRPLDTPWMDRVMEKLSNVGIPYTQIVNKGGRDTWRLNDELKRLWRIT